MKYIFLHIPKNGGTTLQQIVDDQYPKYRIYNILDHERAERLQVLKEKSHFAKDIMLEKLVSVSATTSLDEAKGMMDKSELSGVPVVYKNKLVGMITQNDMAKIYSESD